ncbi:MAG: MerR family transcriptional regulator [Planctomycetes bacterium]|nr:MerR family transcriptional regulator [Planctomycetota bacterium]
MSANILMQAAEVLEMEQRMTITEAASQIGVTPKTIMRWEESGKVPKPKRDWRGWRFYIPSDLDALTQFRNTIRY